MMEPSLSHEDATVAGVEMVDRRGRVGLALCAVGMLASCTAGSATTPIPAGTSATASTSIATPASPTPATSGLRTFHERGLVFAYPAAWREFHNTVTSSFSNSIVYLATVDVPEPCATTLDSVGTRIDCQDRFHLIADSLVVHVMGNGFPGFNVLRNRPASATPLTVGGLPAYVETTASVDPAVGADVSLTWTLSMPGFVDNFYTIVALIRGPDIGPMKDELKALIANLRYDPPVVPLPQASGAADTALAQALGIFASDSPTWRCFPAHVGAAQADVSGWPNGPEFGKPHHATCTTEIEPTALQLWRATFAIQLDEPDPDPNIGSHWMIESWLQPDGTPGETTSGPSLP